MIKPFLQDQAFLDDVTQARRPPRQAPALHVWWLGQSGFLLQWQDRHLLFDPYLSDSLTDKYAGSDTPHVRLIERVIDPRRLTFVDVVTSSHNHTDHLDAATLRPLMRASPQIQVLVPAANRAFAAGRLQVAPQRLATVDVGRPTQLAPFTVHAVPAAHETLDVDEQGRHKTIGLVVEIGPWTVYHSGDTVRFEGMVQWLEPWEIDLAMLPINGRDAARNVAGNLWGPEAVQLARDIRARLVVPCHYDMFAFNTASPDAFVASAEASGQPYRVLRNGERLTLAAPASE